MHDPKWTCEALFNILDNAVKYTPNGGKIYLDVKPWGDFIRISISDNGRGIPENIQSKIFQRFYRAPTSSDMEGIGIGLYLARKIIMLQNGWIEVISRGVAGDGATFAVYLPYKSR
jgi:signal transduction histidine kinase